MKKKISCFSLGMMVLLLVCVFSINVSAHEEDNGIEYLANIAKVQDINQNGSNWKTDEDTLSQNISFINEVQTCIYEDQGSITVHTTIGEDKLEVSGTPTGKSENDYLIYFSGISNNEKYEVITFSYEENIGDSLIFFKKKMQELDATSALKIYLKDVTSDTRDYIVIEIFNYKYIGKNEVLPAVSIDPLGGSWMTKEFEPISSFVTDENTPVPYAKTDVMTKTITKSFETVNVTETHTISLRFTCDYANVPVGGQIAQRYRVTVSDKTMRGANTSSNSDSYLHVDDVKLKQVSIPNTAWASTTIDGKAFPIRLGASLGAGISVGYGALSVSYSIPSSFVSKGYIDLNETFTGYENYSGHYTRSIQTRMGDSPVRLTDEGHYFYVESALRDYGNSKLSSQVLKARWEISIVNAWNLDMSNYSYDQNVALNIL